MSPGNGFRQLHNLSELLFTKGNVPCTILPENIFGNIENSSLKYLDMSGVEFSLAKMSMKSSASGNIKPE